MTTDADASYSRAFHKLLTDEGLADPQVFAQVDVYDELPLYSRLRQIEFLDRWVDEEHGGTCTDGTSEILQPHFWIGNLAHERMSAFRLHLPESRCAAFVSDAYRYDQS